MTIFLAVLVVVALTGYVGYLIGYDTADSQRRPCPQCKSRQELLRADLQLHNLTHAALSEMLSVVREARQQDDGRQ